MTAAKGESSKCAGNADPVCASVVLLQRNYFVSGKAAFDVPAVFDVGVKGAT